MTISDEGGDSNRLGNTVNGASQPPGGKPQRTGEIGHKQLRAAIEEKVFVETAGIARDRQQQVADDSAKNGEGEDDAPVGIAACAPVAAVFKGRLRAWQKRIRELREGNHPDREHDEDFPQKGWGKKGV